MAERTIRREAGRNMVRARRTGEVRLMTGVAGRRRIDVVVVDVALDTSQRCVHAGQRVVCIGGMIECDRCPVACVMAGIARRGERGGCVIGIAGGIPIGSVAAEAVDWQRSVVVVRVALRAGQFRVRAGERKHGRMIEC